MSRAARSTSNRCRRNTSSTPRPARRRSSIRATLMRIKNLQLRARVVVEGFLRGIHRSPYHGFSVEFSEYRQYTPGDDPRYLDWRALRPHRPLLHQAVRGRDEPALLPARRSEPLDGLRLAAVHQDRLRPHAGGDARVFPVTQRDAVGLVTFDEDDRRLPAAAAPARPPAPPDGLLERETARPVDRPRRAARADRRDGPQARPGRADLRPAWRRSTSCARSSATCARAGTRWSCCACSIRPSSTFTFDAPRHVPRPGIGPRLVHRSRRGPRRIPAAVRRARGRT